VRSTAAPYTESRLTRSVANERVGFPVVEQDGLSQKTISRYCPFKRNMKIIYWDKN
jgi:hypothetical protein